MGDEAEEDQDWLVEVVREGSRTEFEKQVAEWRRTKGDADLHIRWRATPGGSVSYRALTPRGPQARPGPPATFIEVEHDGWVWHDYTPLAGEVGDAWIEAPDHSYVGIVWTAGADDVSVEQIFWDEDFAGSPEHQRWGVLAINTPLPMTSAGHAQAFLVELLPALSQRWEAWKQTGRRA